VFVRQNHALELCVSFALSHQPLGTATQGAHAIIAGCSHLFSPVCSRMKDADRSWEMALAAQQASQRKRAREQRRLRRQRLLQLATLLAAYLSEASSARAFWS